MGVQPPRMAALHHAAPASAWLNGALPAPKADTEPNTVVAPNGVARAVPVTAASTRQKLNPALTFDTLVAGRANQMARTAALHVAGAPGVMYNPLFVYGGVGLGKTHLVHAVGNALLKDRPDARVLYLHAEQFISDVVKNYQRKTFDELKAQYHSLDLQRVRGPAGKARAHHHDQRHRPHGPGRHRRAADKPLRRRFDGRHRAARARDAGRDPDQEGHCRGHRDA
jgi:hypothetical protein